MTDASNEDGLGCHDVATDVALRIIEEADSKEDVVLRLVDELATREARIHQLEEQIEREGPSPLRWIGPLLARVAELEKARRWRRVDEEAPPYRVRVEFFDVESFTGMRGDEHIRDDRGLPRDVVSDEPLYWRPLGPAPGGDS